MRDIFWGSASNFRAEWHPRPLVFSPPLGAPSIFPLSYQHGWAGQAARMLHRWGYGWRVTHGDLRAPTAAAAGERETARRAAARNHATLCLRSASEERNPACEERNPACAVSVRERNPTSPTLFLFHPYARRRAPGHRLTFLSWRISQRGAEGATRLVRPAPVRGRQRAAVGPGAGEGCDRYGCRARGCVCVFSAAACVLSYPPWRRWRVLALHPSRSPAPGSDRRHGYGVDVRGPGVNQRAGRRPHPLDWRVRPSSTAPHRKTRPLPSLNSPPSRTPPCPPRRLLVPGHPCRHGTCRHGALGAEGGPAPDAHMYRAYFFSVPPPNPPQCARVFFMAAQAPTLPPRHAALGLLWRHEAPPHNRAHATTTLSPPTTHTAPPPPGPRLWPRPGRRAHLLPPVWRVCRPHASAPAGGGRADPAFLPAVRPFPAAGRI